MKLDDVVPWGRNMAEYEVMFSLSAMDLQSRILGIADGPASFNAQISAQGGTVTSIDPIYGFSGAEIRSRVEATYETIISQVKQNTDRYVWQNFRNADELGQARLAAMELFLADYDRRHGQYLAGSLPDLDLGDCKFDLGLCSHFLFLYSQQLSLTFHLESITKLMQVCTELRIFPLLQLDCSPSPYLEPVMAALETQGFTASVETVGYEFQKGGNQMLRIR